MLLLRQVSFECLYSFHIEAQVTYPLEERMHFQKFLYEREMKQHSLYKYDKEAVRRRHAASPCEEEEEEDDEDDVDVDDEDDVDVEFDDEEQDNGIRIRKETDFFQPEGVKRAKRTKRKVPKTSLPSNQVTKKTAADIIEQDAVFDDLEWIEPMKVTAMTEPENADKDRIFNELAWTEYLTDISKGLRNDAQGDEPIVVDLTSVEVDHCVIELDRNKQPNTVTIGGKFKYKLTPV